MVERFNSTLVNMLRHFVDEANKDWDEFLSMLTYAYNCSVNDVTKESPFFLLYARDPITPTDIAMGLPTPSIDADNYIIRLRIALTRARELTTQQQMKNKARHDLTKQEANFMVRDLIMLQTPYKKKEKASKLQPRFTGPYEVIVKISDLNYEIKPASGYVGQSVLTKMLVHVNRMKRYRPYTDNNNSLQAPEQEAASDSEQGSTHMQGTTQQSVDDKDWVPPKHLKTQKAVKRLRLPRQVSPSIPLRRSSRIANRNDVELQTSTASNGTSNLLPTQSATCLFCEPH